MSNTQKWLDGAILEWCEGADRNRYLRDVINFLQAAVESTREIQEMLGYETNIWHKPTDGIINLFDDGATYRLAPKPDYREYCGFEDNSIIRWGDSICNTMDAGKTWVIRGYHMNLKGEPNGLFLQLSGDSGMLERTIWETFCTLKKKYIYVDNSATVGAKIEEGKINTDCFMPTEMWAKGTAYGPLLSDGTLYLCPECGGYGIIEDDECAYCRGKGTIALDDLRVFKKQQ